MKNSSQTRSIKKSDLPTKICPVCSREFSWRKKWEKVWDDVKYCSVRCRGDKSNAPSSQRVFNAEEFERIIRMAWEDRTPFDAILTQFGLDEEAITEVMQKSLKNSRFSAWKERVLANRTLKLRTEREFKIDVFKSSAQRLDGTIRKRK